MFALRYALLLLVAAGNGHFAVCQQEPSAEAKPLWSLKEDDARETRKQPSPKLNEILNRTGPNIRASANYHDFNDVRLEESIEAWQVLHSKAELFAKNQADYYKPKVEQLLRDANVSSDCKEASSFALDSVKSLRSWAIKSKYQTEILNKTDDSSTGD